MELIKFKTHQSQLPKSILKIIPLALLLLMQIGCGGGAGTNSPIGSMSTTTSVSQVSKSAEIATDSVISVSFNTEIDESSISSSTFAITGPSGPVSGAIIYKNKIAVFTPTVPFLPKTRYIATLGTGIKALNGNSIEPYTWEVTTGKDLLTRSTVETVPSTLFGQHIHRAATVTAWPAIQFGTLRVWDSGAIWPDLEPRKGEWHFDNLDKYVALAEQNGVQLILPLSQTPTWASARPAEKSAYKFGNAAEPANIEDWKGFIRTIATRYKGRIHYYELWNEINAKNFYTGTAEQMVVLAKTAYEIIKEVDPTATVLSPSFSPPESNTKMFSDYIAKGGMNYADIIAYHFYVSPGIPENAISFINKIKNILESAQINKPLWNTESGWHIESLTKSPIVTAQDKVLTNSEASAYIARSYILQWAMGVDRFYFYAYDDYNSGLVEDDGVSLKQSAIAYNEIFNWLVGSKISSLNKNSDGTWIVQITTKNGIAGRIAWRTEGTVDMKIPSEWDAKKVSYLTGKSESVQKESHIVIGIAPILILSE